MKLFFKNILNSALLFVASCESRHFPESGDAQVKCEMTYEFVVIKDNDCVGFSLNASENLSVVKMLESIPEDMLPGHINSSGVTSSGRKYHASRQIPKVIGFISEKPGIKNGVVIPENIVMWVNEDQSLLDAIFNDAYADLDKMDFKPVIRKYMDKPTAPESRD